MHNVEAGASKGKVELNAKQTEKHSSEGKKWLEEVEVLSKSDGSSGRNQRNVLEANAIKPFFAIGMRFRNLAEFREAVEKYSIENVVRVVYKPSARERLKIVCQDGCPFLIYVARVGRREGLEVKMFNHEHKCSSEFRNARVSERFLANYFKAKICRKPQTTHTDMKKEIEKELKVRTSRRSCGRAKHMILQELPMPELPQESRKKRMREEHEPNKNQLSRKAHRGNKGKEPAVASHIGRKS